MNSELPELLYRYRPVAKSLSFTPQEIFHGSLFCSHHNNLNDPFDGLARARKITTDETLDLPAGPHTVHIDKHWAIASFTETWENPTMWAHYADNYTGICLGYDSAKLKECLDTNQNNDPLNRLFDLKKIEYVDSFPDIFDNDMHAITTKTKNWDYEKEWRVVTQSPIQAGLEPDIHGTAIDVENALKQIILGYKIDLATINSIRFVRDNISNSIEIRQIKFHEDKTSFILGNPF
jgi:hypothetical protein